MLTFFWTTKTESPTPISWICELYDLRVNNLFTFQSRQSSRIGGPDSTISQRLSNLSEIEQSLRGGDSTESLTRRSLNQHSASSEFADSRIFGFTSILVLADGADLEFGKSVGRCSEIVERFYGYSTYILDISLNERRTITVHSVNSILSSFIGRNPNIP